jgi:protein-disulfide isomerase
MDTSMNGRTIAYLLGLVAVALFSWGLARTMGAPSGGRGSGAVEGGNGSEVLARVETREITRADIEETAGGQFMKLRQELFALTEESLSRTIDVTLLDVAAEKRGLDRDGFIASVVDSNPPEITQTQIDSVYEAFKDRISMPREVVDPQIEAALINQERRARYDSLLKSLREEYEVVNYLEPQRFEVAAVGPAKGPEGAPVTIVEFSDFECPFCKRIHPTLQQVMETYDGQVRFVYRHLPLVNIHPSAMKAAEASMCADAQGRFWDMHDALFEGSGLAVASLKATAAEIGLDTEAFAQCLDSGEYADEVSTDMAAARELGIGGTPALFINGRYMSGAQPYDAIARVIDDELQRGS